jgi:Bacterial PH domain
MNFRASQDTKTQVITAVVILVLFAAAYLPTWLGSDDATHPFIIMGIPLINLAIIGAAYYFSIRGYYVDNEELIIGRPFSEVKILRSDIIKVELLSEDPFKSAIRLIGSGGMFGYYGSFSNPILKKFTMYGTQTKNYVLILTLSGKKIIVTPDEASAFIEALK